MHEVASYNSLRRMKFQKTIRKTHLEQIFQKQRLSVMSKYQPKPNYTNNHPNLQLAALYNQLADAREKQHYEELISTKKEQYPFEWFHLFLSRDVSYTLLAMATSILGDYSYYFDGKVPTITTIKCLVDCFKDAENEILSNIILVVQNILHDYKELKEIFLDSFDFVDLVVQKLEKYRNHKELVMKLLKVVYHLLNLSKPHAKFWRLVNPMLTFIASFDDQTTPHAKEINLTAIYNFHALAKLFPEQHLQVNPGRQLRAYIIQHQIIQKLIQLLESPKYAERRFTYVIFDLIQLCRQQFTQQHITEVVMPLIIGLRKLGFEYGSRSSVYTADKIKVKAYDCILYFTEHHLPLAHKMFSYDNYQMSNSFVEQLRAEQDPKVTEIVAKIMYNVHGCLPQETAVSSILRSQVKRAIQLNNYKYEIENYFRDYIYESNMEDDIQL